MVSSHYIYDLIKARRDVRDEFLPTPVPDDLLYRLLDAAHHGPSVGFQQPWNFIIIKDADRRQKVREIFARAHSEEAEVFDKERQSAYRRLKLEGIVKAPINVVVTCDKTRDGQKGIGRSHNPQMSAYSCVCAIQNLWLAARAENIGVGWVSIYHEDGLRALLKIPDNIEIIGYLCLGYVSYFRDKPELEEARWRHRLNLDDLIYQDYWGKKG